MQKKLRLPCGVVGLPSRGLRCHIRRPLRGHAVVYRLRPLGACRNPGKAGSWAVRDKNFKER